MSAPGVWFRHPLHGWLPAKYGFTPPGRKSLRGRKAKERRRILLIRRAPSRDCPLCGERMWSPQWGDPAGERALQASVDHIVPRSKGGSDDKSNLRVVCKGCNEAKGDGE